MSNQHQGDVLKTSLSTMTDQLPTSLGRQYAAWIKARGREPTLRFFHLGLSFSFMKPRKIIFKKNHKKFPVV